jgi:hypothetical protein
MWRISSLEFKYPVRSGEWATWCCGSLSGGVNTRPGWPNEDRREASNGLWLGPAAAVLEVLANEDGVGTGGKFRRPSGGELAYGVGLFEGL